MKLKKSEKRFIGYIGIIVILFSTGCETKYETEVYRGVPKNLSYAEVQNYIIGESYVSTRPTVMGGANAIFSLDEISGPANVDIMRSSFSVVELSGQIRINEFALLDAGEYILDIKVINDFGEAVFPAAYKISMVQSVPKDLRYVPSVLSVYGNETGPVTDSPLIKGGGPFKFKFDVEDEFFEIDSITGVISLSKAFQIGNEEKIEKRFFVSAKNDSGSFVATKPITIEMIGNNVGKLAYSSEVTAANQVTYGLLNSESFFYLGEITDTIDGEPYTTTLDSPPDWGTFWRNVWCSHFHNINPVGETQPVKTNCVFLRPKSTGDEILSVVVSEFVDLTDVDSAYVEIAGFKRFRDVTNNQFIKLLIVADDQFDPSNIWDMEWTVIHPTISNNLATWASPMPEEKIINSGTHGYGIPDEFKGRKVRVAIEGRYLNKAAGNLGLNVWIYKWQVRTIK